MSSSTHRIILYDSDIEDAFSSINIPNYASASPNYSLASPGNTFFDTSEVPSEDQLVRIAVSPFSDDPYIKVRQAYYATNELPIPPPPALIAPSLVLSPQFDPRNLFLPEEILPPQKQVCFLSHSSTDFAASPQIFEIGESSHKTPLERLEERIEAIPNHLDERPFECVEEMEDKIRGLGNGRVIIQRDFDKLETELEEARSPPIRYKESSGCDPITMDLLPPGFLEPLYPSFMNVVHNQGIKHMIPPTSPRDTETPIGPPMPLSLSSSVGSSSPVRLTTPPPDYPFNESIFAELDNSLWIIPRPLGSEPISKEPNKMAPKRTSTSAALTMTQAAIRKLVFDLDLSRLAITVNRLERSIQIGINKWYQSLLRNSEQIKVLPPKTVKEIRAREREGKARTTLLMALPEDHLAKFHKMTDAKEMWEAIKSRFGRNDESKKMQKYMLKKQFESFSLSNSEGLHKGYNGFQSLLSQLDIHGAGLSTEDANQKFLRVFESDIKGSTGSSSSARNNRHCFFPEKYYITNDVENLLLIGNVVFVSSESTSSTNEVSTAHGVSTSSGNNSHREGFSLYTDELMFSFFANQSSALQLDHEDLEQDEPKALVTIDGDVINWSGHAKKDTENYAFMAYSTSNLGLDNEVTSCSKVCKESYAKLKKLYDEQREKIGDASIEIQAYTQALKSKLLNSQMTANDKIGLGYGDQTHEDVLSYENEVFQSVFDSRNSDVEDKPLYDRFSKTKGMHAVPTPMIGNYMPPHFDLGIDKSNFTYGPKQSKTSESDAKTRDFASCVSNSSVETLESVPKPAVNEPKVVNKPKVWSDPPLIDTSTNLGFRHTCYFLNGHTVQYLCD
ncbi:hypothetical protein Tco_0024961 [Tanacetum coccineum]